MLRNVIRTSTCGELRQEHIGHEVVLQGWAGAVRDRGGMAFVVLRDRYGSVQITVDERCPEPVRQAVKAVRLEYVVQVSGRVVARDPRAVNDKMPTGAIEVLATDLQILSRTRPLPFALDARGEATEETRLRYRFLDLRRPELQRNLILRHQAAQAARRYLDREGFLEVETPFLTKATPEGARDYLVPSRVHPGHWYALPQSPQIFKQILMVAGIDRYFQIVRCFRDEDLRADRQPEFTQIDLEMSFATRESVIEVTEGVTRAMWRAVLDRDIGEIPRLTYQEALDRFGVDAPDLRFGMELRDLAGPLGQTSFPPVRNALDAGGIVRGFAVDEAAGSTSRKVLDRWTTFVRGYGMGGLLWGKVTEDRITGPLGKAVADEARAGFLESIGGAVGDVLLVGAGAPAQVNPGMGRLRAQVARERELIPADTFAFCWVTDFPLFERDDDGRWTSVHHPFTMPRAEHVPWLGTERMGEILSDAYDLVCNGYEIGGGSIRIHQEEVQQAVFLALGIGPDEQRDKFGFLLDALAHGAPPHGGLAFGFDRCAMVLAGADSIREVIAFPKTTSAQDLMCGAPSSIPDADLVELKVRSAVED